MQERLLKPTAAKEVLHTRAQADKAAYKFARTMGAMSVMTMSRNTINALAQTTDRCPGTRPSQSATLKWLRKQHKKNALDRLAQFESDTQRDIASMKRRIIDLEMLIKVLVIALLLLGVMVIWLFGVEVTR